MWTRHLRRGTAIIVAGAGLTGALIGWALLRVVYLLEQAADPKGTSSVWSLGWTGASFSYSLVVAFVVGGTLAATAIAVVVLIAHAARAASIAGDRMRRDQSERIATRGGQDMLLYTETPETQSALTLLQKVESRTIR